MSEDHEGGPAVRLSKIASVADGVYRMPPQRGDRAPDLDLEDIGRELLRALGEDPDREGLRDTPRRWARMWNEFVGYHDTNVETVFDSVRADQVVIVRGITVWSVCEHHLLPFSCVVSIGYQTRGRVLGLSKFARIAHLAAHRLQLQERLVEDIAAAVEKVTGSPDVAVVARGRHLCLEMRGIRTNAEAVTSVLHGQFRDDVNTRAEFLRLAGV